MKLRKLAALLAGVALTGGMVAVLSVPAGAGLNVAGETTTTTDPHHNDGHDGHDGCDDGHDGHDGCDDGRDHHETTTTTEATTTTAATTTTGASLAATTAKVAPRVSAGARFTG